MPLTDRVTGFSAWLLEFPTGPVTWIFLRYEYNRYDNSQIEERVNFECFKTMSLCPTGFGEITQGYCEVFAHVCLIGWQNFSVCKPTQQNFDGMWIRLIVPGCSSIKSIANTFHALRISFKHREWLFLTIRYDVIVYVILLPETFQSILFLQVHHLNSNWRENDSYSCNS